jgi:hypothetical protein
MRTAWSLRDERGRPTPLLIGLAAIGGIFLLVVAANRWGTPSDEHAYWLAAQRLIHGEPLYDPTATSVTPYAYWYPPFVAQVLAPIAAVLPAMAFTAAWTAVMLICLWWLAGRDVLLALALVAFPPVAVEFWYRNIHLVLAVLIVLAIRGIPALYAVGALIKFSPGLGVPFLLARTQWRDAAIAVLTGVALLVISVALSPDAWRQYLDILASRGPTDVSGLLPIPYIARAVTGLVLALVAARLEPRIGEPLLIIAIVVALPTLWMAALSTLIALVPILRGQGIAERTRREPSAL